MSPSFLTVVRAVSRVTFLEILRDKVLYNILVIAGLLLAVAFISGSLTYGRPDRVVADFGLLVVSLGSMMLGLFTGAALLGREFDRRTIFVALSRPISRVAFTVGKFGGLVLVQLFNWAMLSLAMLLILWVSSPDAGRVFTGTMVWALGLALVQAILMSAVAILISAISTTSLAAILGLGIFVVGSNVSQISLIAAKMKGGPGKLGLKIVAAVFPSFEHFQLGFKLTYGLPVSWGYGLTAIAYGIFGALAAVLLAGRLIRNRES